MKKRKIIYVTGTRADYGLMKSTLTAIKNHPKLELSLSVTGMHLEERYGKTVNEIKKDGFSISARIKSLDFAEQFLGFDRIFKKIKSDIVLLEGDRKEMLAAGLAAKYLNLSVAHACGGDITPGYPIDDLTRNCITKLADIHFPGTRKSARRIEKMGESKSKIFMLGDPGTDSIRNVKTRTPGLLAEKFNFDFKKPILMVIQHPVFQDSINCREQMQSTLEAVCDLKYQAIVVYPNSDKGGEEIINIIERYKKYSFIKIYKSISYDNFIGLMKNVNVLVGNSSAAIVEAPFFKLPAVNVGSRQKLRECGANIINTGYNKEEIKKAINKALFDKKFLAKIKKSKNPYIGNNTGKKIAQVLAEFKI